MKRFLLISVLMLSIPFSGRCTFDNFYVAWTIFQFPGFGFTDYEGYGYGMDLGSACYNNFPFKVGAYFDYDDFWKGYSDGFKNARAVATQKDDKEMLYYLDLLDEYYRVKNEDYDMTACFYRDYGSEYEVWHYPSKQELAVQKSRLQSIIDKTINYNGKQYQDRFFLLTMRAMFNSGNFVEMCDLWNTKGKNLNLDSSDCKNEIMSRYAGALLRTGNELKAAAIYAELGDKASLNMCFNSNPAQVLELMLQIYANTKHSELIFDMIPENADYITWDLTRTKFYGYDDIQFHNKIVKTTKNFVVEANKLAADPSTDMPNFWKMLAAYFDFYTGNKTIAYQEIEEAINLNGPEYIKTDARNIRLLFYLQTHKRDASYEQFLLNELKWINLGRDSCAIIQNVVIPNLKDKTLIHSFTTHYGDNADQTAKTYANIIRDTAKSELTKYIFENYTNKNYFEYNDVIGTQYISEGNLTKALEYLQNPLAHCTDGIYYYLSNDFTIEPWFLCQSGWYGEYENGFKFSKYSAKDDLEYDVYDFNSSMLWHSLNNTDSIVVPYSLEYIRAEKENAIAEICKNRKVEFCKLALKLKSEYDTTTNKIEKMRLAYQLGTIYYQAREGDCWYLTEYARKTQEWGAIVQVGNFEYFTEYAEVSYPKTNKRFDYLWAAVKYLQEAAKPQNDDFELMENANFALAYICNDVCLSDGYYFFCPDSKKGSIFKSIRNKAYTNLHNNGRYPLPSDITLYLSQCGIYRDFIAYN